MNQHADRDRHRGVFLAVTVLSFVSVVTAHSATQHMDDLVVSNTFTQVRTDGSASFAGPVSMSNGLMVAGAMTVPPQGDVAMGNFTNGVSQGGVQGALPLGQQGDLLYHTGSAWAALTSVHYDATTGRLYFNSTTNSGTYVDTDDGSVNVDGDMNIQSNQISGLADPTSDQQAATKAYVDDKGRYVDRGDNAAYDFETGDFTTDSNWYDLDLSSILPVGAKGVVFRVLVQDDATGSYVVFRKNGFANTWNSGYIRTQVANMNVDGTITIGVDSNRKIEYKAINRVFAVIKLNVVGWFE